MEDTYTLKLTKEDAVWLAEELETTPCFCGQGGGDYVCSVCIILNDLDALMEKK